MHGQPEVRAPSIDRPLYRELLGDPRAARRGVRSPEAAMRTSAVLLGLAAAQVGPRAPSDRPLYNNSLKLFSILLSLLLLLAFCCYCYRFSSYCCNCYYLKTKIFALR